MATVAVQRRNSPSGLTLARIGALLVALWILASVSLTQGDLAIYWVFGIAFGVILQRSRLCFASAFRDLFLLQDGGNLRGILTGLAIASIGFAFVQMRAVPTPTPGVLPDQAHLMPLSAQLIVGGLLFGVGMVLAGGCVSGTMYRIGEGYVGSLVAMLGILAGLVVATQQWNWWWQTFSAHAPTIWLPSYLGYGGAIVIILVALAAAYIASIWWELRAGPRPSFPVKRSVEAPALTVGQWVEQRYRALFGKGWPFVIGALALAVLNIFVYMYSQPLGVTGELANWGNRAVGLFGVTVPTLLGASNLAGCLLVFNANASWVDTGTMLDGGLILGSFIAALAANEFKLRVPRQPVRYVQSMGGGVLMGYGAGLAAGCTIGAFFSGIPSLGLNGWVFGLALLVGAFAGVQVIKKL